MALDKTVEMKNVVVGAGVDTNSLKPFFTLAEMEAYNADVGETLLLLGRDTLFDGHVMFYVTQLDDPSPKKSEMLNNGLFAVEVPNALGVQSTPDGVEIKNYISGKSLILKNDGSVVLPASNLNMPNQDVVLGMNEVYSKLYNTIGYKFDTHVFIQDPLPKKENYVYLDKHNLALYYCIANAPAEITAPSHEYFVDISLRVLHNICLGKNFKGEYNPSKSYRDGDVVYVTGHEPAYVFETTINDRMPDPEHPNIFRKSYRINDTMRYRMVNGKWDMIFDEGEADVEFYTIPQKLPTQTYKSTVDNYYPWSKMKRVVMNGFSSTSEKYELNDNDSTLKQDGSPANLTSEGNVMVRIPKFWFDAKFTDKGRRFRIYTYDNPVGKTALGINPHPLFKRPNGTYMDNWYSSAFEGSILNGQLVSISGVNPQVSQTEAWFQNAARQGRSVNFNLLCITEIAAWEALFIVEFGSLNSQSVLGQGRSNTSSLASTGRTYMLGNKSGRAGTDDANDFTSYRGIENPYGNIWKFTLGLRLTNNGYHYTHDPAKFQAGAAGMTHIPKKLDFKIPDDYITKMETIKDYEFLLFPSETGGSATTYYCDHFWSHDVGEENIVVFGGNWVYGSSCGLFCFDAPNVASYVHNSVGSRLSLQP